MKLFLNNESVRNMRSKYFYYRKMMNPLEDIIVCLVTKKEPAKKKKDAIKKLLLLEGEYRKVNNCWNSIPINFCSEIQPLSSLKKA